MTKENTLSEQDQAIYRLLFMVTDLPEDQRKAWRDEIAKQMPDFLPVANACIDCARTYKGTKEQLKALLNGDPISAADCESADA